jgi:hypothetical protein
LFQNPDLAKLVTLFCQSLVNLAMLIPELAAGANASIVSFQAMYLGTYVYVVCFLTCFQALIYRGAAVE